MQRKGKRRLTNQSDESPTAEQGVVDDSNNGLRAKHLVNKRSQRLKLGTDYDESFKDRLENCMRLRPVRMEREVAVGEFRDIPELTKIMTNRGWTFAMGKPTHAHVEIVQEFYASLHENGLRHTVAEVRVRGKTINFSPDCIARIRNIPRVNETIYASLKINEKELLKELYVNPASKKVGAKFEQSKLKPLYAALNVIISFNVLPSRHRSTLTLEGAKLLYAIRTGVPVDLSSIIFQIIAESAANRFTTHQLPFGSLINGIAKDASVIIPKNRLESPKNPINNYTLSRIRQATESTLGAVGKVVNSDVSNIDREWSSQSFDGSEDRIMRRLDELQSGITNILEQVATLMTLKTCKLNDLDARLKNLARGHKTRM